MTKQNTVLVGMQYGDEGKGKFSHFLSQEHDVFVRYQGGGNAGHTIYPNGIKVVTHYLPVGIVEDHVTCILGNGMVISPDGLVREIEEVALAIGKDPKELAKRIFVSNKAHVVTDSNIDLDSQREKTQNIGTTKTGIGPTYEAKFNRTGLPIGIAVQRGMFKEFSGLLGKNVCNAEILVNELDEQGKSILFEGAQGVLLDVDFGQYPYVTSSNCIPGAVRTGAGFNGKIDRVIGVFKPYMTRVGSGPFVTAMSDNTDRLIRMAGHEFGATTGRNRYCGFLDLFALKYACKVAGVTELAIAKMDVLDYDEAMRNELVKSLGGESGIPDGNEFTMAGAIGETIQVSGGEYSWVGDCFGRTPVCTSYEIDGRSIDNIMDFPFGLEWESVKPVYSLLGGWSEHSGNESLTMAAHSSFLSEIEAYTGVPIGSVSVGPKPEDTYRRNTGIVAR